MNFNLSQASQNLPASLLCDEEVLPRNRPPRLLSAQAFAPTLESSFSGITYHLAQAGLSTGCLEGCFSLYSGERPPAAGAGLRRHLEGYASSSKTEDKRF